MPQPEQEAAPRQESCSEAEDVSQEEGGGQEEGQGEGQARQGQAEGQCRRRIAFCSSRYATEQSGFSFVVSQVRAIVFNREKKHSLVRDHMFASFCLLICKYDQC